MHKKRNIILASFAAVVATATAIGTLTDVPEKLDPWIHTEAEALMEHGDIILAAEQSKQTQAGFNAYTLKALMEQEIVILELRIGAEEDEDEKALLEAELAAKRAFIRQLEEEERRQLLRGNEA